MTIHQEEEAPMPDAEAPAVEGPRTRPFAAWLQEQRAGSLHGELSAELAELVAQVIEHQKEGTLTLTIKVKPTGDNAVQVSDTVKAKAPEPDRGAALFFADARGNLSRRDPRQPELPLRDASAPSPSPDSLREAN